MASKEEIKISDAPSLGTAACWYIRNDEQKGSKRNKPVPCGRWGHASASIDNNIYVYGGTGDKASAKYWESIYKLDLETWEWTNLEAVNKPPISRDSHSITYCQNKLYIFGGSSDGESRNDLFEFDLATNTWKEIQMKGIIPAAREGHSACLYDGKYLVVYGGWNGDETLNDCYVFDITSSTWIHIEKRTGADPSPRESHSCALLRDQMYIFGGQGNSIMKNGESQDLFFNDLHRFKILFENNAATAVWEKLEPEGPLPPHRSSNSVCSFKDRYIFVIGGEGYPQEGQEEKEKNKSRDNDEDYSCFPKNDIWYYDVEVNRWTNYRIRNHMDFASRFAHSCNAYKENLVVFGGLKDYQNTSSEICVLAIDGANPFLNAKVQPKAKKESKAMITQEGSDKSKSQLPAKSAKAGKPGQDINLLGPTHHGGGPVEANKEGESENVTELEGPMVSTSFLHSLSSIISWPLAAFGMLLDNCLINKASNMKIDVLTKKRKHQEPIINEEVRRLTASEADVTYFIIEDNGKGWKHHDFINIFMKYDTDAPEASSQFLEDSDANPQEEERRKKINEYAFNLKVAGFRLGRTLISVSRSEDEISVGFISVDKRFNPDVHGNHVFLYSWRRSTNEYLTSQAQKNKDIIMNALAGVFTENDILENIDKVSNRLIVLDLAPVAASGKGQDYELLLPKKGIKTNDIMVRTLDKSLKPFYSDPANSLIELSLRTYFSYFFLDPSQANIEIYINDSQVSLINVKEAVESREGQLNYSKLREEGLFDGFFLQPESMKDLGDQKDSSPGLRRRPSRKGPKPTEDKKVDLNQGILMYFENRLIRRLENPKLGNLDFLSLQIRDAQNNKQPITNLFDINGYVEVKTHLRPNMFKTEIENPYYSNYLYSSIMTKLQTLNSVTNEKRKGEVTLQDLDNVSKKVKPNT